ncbi:Carboxylesterase NlhH [Baekduia alba]|uniref:alpha/beta hydrolase n=1 Tax=Baekduia alba TaxID=2997333 RepID=UPI002341BB42|nr:alpha/beta hydrolase [Baekduia alba]WCB94562.1 Carboxylesterase NlhH [Baekduia alba]
MHLDVVALRESSRARAASRPRGPELHAVADAIVPDTPGVRARHYRPVQERRPLLVFLHGGLWVLGDLGTHDRLCRRLAAEAGIEVLAVDYRRAPEHPWPAAVDDAVAAARWAAAWLTRGHGGSLAIGGDSAGGCIAALAALRLRDEPEDTAPLAAQVLICPNTDLTAAQPSMSEVSADFGLDPEAVRAAASLWVPRSARHADGDVSPLHARSLAGLPPAIVVTAEHDPLRDEGDAYASRLAGAGVAVTHRCEPGLPHGFVQNMDTERADAAAATDRLIADVRTALRGPAARTST